MTPHSVVLSDDKNVTSVYKKCKRGLTRIQRCSDIQSAQKVLASTICQLDS